MIKEHSDIYNMNLFILDQDVTVNAQSYFDSYVNKITLEACQMLCTAHHVLGTDPAIIPYRRAYLNHPVTQWVRKNNQNYWWTVNLVDALIAEFQFRFGKVHACQRVLDFCNDTEIDIPSSDYLDFLGIMVEDGTYRIVEVDSNEDAVRTYRQYILDKKMHLAKFTRRTKPKWMPSVRLNTMQLEQSTDATKYWEKLSFKSQPFDNAYPQ